MAERSSNLICPMFRLTISPTRTPVDARNSTIALSLCDVADSRKFSRSSSDRISLTTFVVFTLCILRTGDFTIKSSSSSHEKKLENIRRILSIVTLLDPF